MWAARMEKHDDYTSEGGRRLLKVAHPNGKADLRKGVCGRVIVAAVSVGPAFKLPSYIVL